MSDEELVQRARMGDQTAFDELVRRHCRGVVRALRERGWGEEAQDIAQEVFLRLLGRLFHFRDNFNRWLYKVMLPQAIADYLRGSPQALTERALAYLDAVEHLTTDREREPTDQEIANHLALQGWSLEDVQEVKQKVEEKLHWRSLDEPVEGEDAKQGIVSDTVSGDEPSPEEQAIRNLVREPIQRALRALGFKGQDVWALVLHVVEGLEWADIDRLFGCPRGVMETRVSRLKKEMRRKLLEEHHHHIDWSAKHAAYERVWANKEISQLQHVLVKAVWFCGRELLAVARDIKCHGNTAKCEFGCVLEKIAGCIRDADYLDALMSLSDNLKGGNSNAKK